MSARDENLANSTPQFAELVRAAQEREQDRSNRRKEVHSLSHARFVAKKIVRTSFRRLLRGLLQRCQARRNY